MSPLPLLADLDASCYLDSSEEKSSHALTKNDLLKVVTVRVDNPTMQRSS